MSAGQTEYVSNEDRDDLKCMICLEFAVEPYQHDGCGKLLCTNCRNKLKRNNPCPTCREVNPKYFKDRKSRREILAVRIQCGNMKNGCNWRGIIEEWEEHVLKCGYALVSCPNGCNARTVLRIELENHLQDCPMRQYCCVWCGTEGTFTSITNDHEQVCPRMEIHCPQLGCREVLERRLVPGHIATTCKYSVVPCKYDSIGCCVKKRRVEISDHEANNEEHLHLALKTVQQLQKEISSLKKNTFTFKLKRYYSLKQRNHGWFEDYVGQCGYTIHISIYPNGYPETNSNIYLSAFVDVEEPSRDSSLEWPFEGTATVEILNQITNHSHYKMTVESFDPRSNHPEVVAKFTHLIPHTSVEAPPHNGCQYLVDDSLYFRVTVTSARSKPWLECSLTSCASTSDTDSYVSE